MPGSRQGCTAHGGSGSTCRNVGMHRLANAETQHAGTEFDDLATKLMTENALALYPGQRMGASTGMNTGPATYSCKSDPHIPHHCTRICSQPAGGEIGSGTSSTRISLRPCQTAAGMLRWGLNERVIANKAIGLFAQFDGVNRSEQRCLPSIMQVASLIGPKTNL